MSSRRQSALNAAGLVLVFLFLALAGSLPAQKFSGSDLAKPIVGTLTASEIVGEMQVHNKLRAEDLRHYQSLRHYEVQYKGFSATINAKMEVEADYDSVSGKTFRIVSQSGSGMLVDKVLKKLLQSEKEASADQKSTALTPANYTFRLVGQEDVAGRPAYILDVSPLVDNKFLYRGKIWVDAADFAVAQIDASPAKNPSFWISSTAIHHRYIRTDGFWLPEQNRSETKVRVGGKAVLTIDYGPYQVVPGAVAAGGGL
jgi:hypothetical protein